MSCLYRFLSLYHYWSYSWIFSTKYTKEDACFLFHTLWMECLHMSSWSNEPVAVVLQYTVHMYSTCSAIHVHVYTYVQLIQFTKVCVCDHALIGQIWYITAYYDFVYSVNGKCAYCMYATVEWAQWAICFCAALHHHVKHTGTVLYMYTTGRIYEHL